MKRNTLYMLLIGLLLSVTVGFANTSEKEQNHYSDGVGLVDVVVMDIENQVTFETVFDFQRIDNYTLVCMSPLSNNMVKDLQTSNVAIASDNRLRLERVTTGVLRIQLKARKRIGHSTYERQERGAITQLLFYTQIGKLDVQNNKKRI